MKGKQTAGTIEQALGDKAWGLLRAARRCKADKSINWIEQAQEYLAFYFRETQTFEERVSVGEAKYSTAAAMFLVAVALLDLMQAAAG